MPQVTLQAGMKMFVPDHDDIKRATHEALTEDREFALARGNKHMDLPQTLKGIPASSAILLGAASGQVLGPESGYAWQLRRLVVSGLTAGATPDIVNLFKNDRTSGPPLWQFNGNNFGYTFGRLELVIRPGETLTLQNVGTIASTSLVMLSGELDEIPAQMLYRYSE